MDNNTKQNKKSEVKTLFNLYRKISKQSSEQIQNQNLPENVKQEVLIILSKVQFFENVSKEFREYLIPFLTTVFFDSNTWIISF